MPFKPSERQYRSFEASNFRALDNEGSEESSYVVRGYYTTFSDEYEIFPGYFERIDRTALDQMDTSDVIFQLNHEGAPLARLRNKSLRIGVDDHGGWAEADLGGSQQGRDVYEAIANGLIDRMSFGFTIADDGIEWDEDDDGNIHALITQVDRLYDVSCVSIPANEGTEISARSLYDAAIEAKKQQEELAKQEELEAEQRAEEERAEQERIEIEEALRRRRRRAMALKLKTI